jgi:hypothetical protein
VSEIPKGKVKEAAEAYRAELTRLGCVIISEDRGFQKNRITYVLRAPRNKKEAQLTAALCEHVPGEVRGEIDWEVE